MYVIILRDPRPSKSTVHDKVNLCTVDPYLLEEGRDGRVRGEERRVEEAGPEVPLKRLCSTPCCCCSNRQTWRKGKQWRWRWKKESESFGFEVLVNLSQFLTFLYSVHWVHSVSYVRLLYLLNCLYC